VGEWHVRHEGTKKRICDRGKGKDAGRVYKGASIWYTTTNQFFYPDTVIILLKRKERFFYLRFNAKKSGGVL
jgi:hypothetical protein